MIRFTCTSGKVLEFDHEEELEQVITDSKHLVSVTRANDGTAQAISVQSGPKGFISTWYRQQ